MLEVPDRVDKIKICSGCGRAFCCGQGSPGCWCEAMELRRETLAEIRVLADDCICPTCLAGFAASERTMRAGSDVAKDSNDRGTTWAKAVPDAAVRSRGVTPAWGIAALALLGGAL